MDEGQRKKHEDYEAQLQAQFDQCCELRKLDLERAYQLSQKKKQAFAEESRRHELAKKLASGVLPSSLDCTDPAFAKDDLLGKLQRAWPELEYKIPFAKPEDMLNVPNLHNLYLHIRLAVTYMLSLRDRVTKEEVAATGWKTRPLQKLRDLLAMAPPTEVGLRLQGALEWIIKFVNVSLTTAPSLVVLVGYDANNHTVRPPRPLPKTCYLA
jgi:hypothetical protein